MVLEIAYRGDQPHEITMSSREIAELTGKRHDNVKRTIESLAKDKVIQLPQFEEVKNHLGKKVETFVPSGEKGTRDSIVVVAQLSPEFTARLVDRWQELENAYRAVAPSNDLIASLQNQLAEQQTKLDDLSQTTALKKRPSNTFNIKLATAWAKETYSLSATIARTALLDLDYSPRPSHAVLNQHPDADGATFSVWYITDVRKTFGRFASECRKVSKRLWTHGHLDKTFRMSRPEDGIAF